MNRYCCLLFLLLLLPAALWAQGIKGRVISGEGEPLAYTTIYISETGSGSISNAYGFYELRLNPGTYTVSFQYLGYASVRTEVVVTEEMTQRDIVLQKQVFRLGEATVKAGKEDPAYPIMRKAIAKSSFHRQQVDRYSCEVYVKGSGGVTDAPRWLMRLMEKEGVDTATSFVSESISRITYTRPGNYEEEVISIRTSGDDRSSSPMSYINGSFYEPTIGQIVSPLSPKAFAYYRFQYLSSYTDRGYTINRIQVIPKSKNEDVVGGILNLVEGLWSIHSFEFEIIIQGIIIDARQVFAPVKEDVWLPVSHRYEGRGNIFGVRFAFDYIATVSNYEVEINPDLAVPIVVIDEKTEREALREREGRSPISGKELSATEEKLAAGEEISRKELRKLLKDYEREERKKTDEPEVISTRSFKVDSLAYQSDSTFWANRRPIPLSNREIKGYMVQDSLAIELKKREEGDTLGTQRKFKPGQLLTGGSYDLGNGKYLRIHNPLTTFAFNTVDGYNMEYRLSMYKRYENKTRIEISPMYRFNTARPQHMGTLRTRLNYRNGPRKGELKLEGGWYYSQFNPNVPIPIFQNTFSTLFFQNNFMKVYDRNFGHLSWQHEFKHGFTIKPEAWYERRIETFNNTSAVWIPWPDRDYKPNTPVNQELDNTGFGRSDAFKTQISVTWRPGITYGKYNDNYFERGRSPEFTARVLRAVPGVAESSIDYTRLNLIFENWFDINIGGELGVRADAGLFLHRNNIEFPDFQHFMGNETPFTRFGQLNGYSILEYYAWSNSNRYLSVYTNYTGRRFLLTQIGKLRMTGLKENILFNYLLTPTARSYMEFGYSLTNVFRVARIDFVTSFIEGGYREFRIQVGIFSEIFQVE